MRFHVKKALTRFLKGVSIGALPQKLMDLVGELEDGADGAGCEFVELS